MGSWVYRTKTQTINWHLKNLLKHNWFAWVLRTDMIVLKLKYLNLEIKVHCSA